MDAPIETRPRKSSGLFFRLTLLLGVPFSLILLVLLVVVALSGHDQFRSLSVSDNTFERILKRDEMERVKVSARQPDSKESKAALLEIAQNSFPWPDTAKMQAGQQESFRLFKVEMSEVMLDHLILVERTRGLEFNDAYKQLEAAQERLRSIWKKYQGTLNHLSKAERASIWNRIQDLFNATLTGLYVDRTQWINAAACNLYQWDKATYYLRRGGFKGRCVLALWSLQRRIQPNIFKE